MNAGSSPARLRVEAFAVTLFADFQRRRHMNQQQAPVLLDHPTCRCPGGRVRGRSVRIRDPAVAGDLGGDIADPPDVEVPMLAGEAQFRGEHATHDVAVEQGHRSCRLP